MIKEVVFPRGRGKEILHIDGRRLAAVIEPAAPPVSAGDESGVVRQALEHPIGTKRLRDLAAGRKRVLVISSDHTRPVPSRVTMPLLLSEIRSGNPQAEITILIAAGMHRPTTRQELMEKFGEEIVRRERIEVHRAGDAESMAYCGRLPSGGELWLNRLVRQADLVVSEGFVEPHFFAGFSGGRKSILPGVASAKTVLYNHNARFIADPHARQGSLTDNPIHRDMLFAAQAAGLSFILNVLLDARHRVAAAYAGDRELAHQAGCEACEKMCRAEPVVSDIVFTSNGGYPLDQNVYQSVKGMTAAEACVRPGGAVVMIAGLGDGHGGEDFYRWFAERNSPEEVTRAIEGIPPESTRMDQWEAQILARVMGRARCWFVTGGENRRLVTDMHFRWAPTADEALKEATALLGENASVTAIPDGVGVILRGKSSFESNLRG